MIDYIMLLKMQDWEQRFESRSDEDFIEKMTRDFTKGRTRLCPLSHRSNSGEKPEE